ncbi:MAG TPA: cob(I)yrinic acid a,c-diamide adenosyltransferase [Anaerolineae bacterium]|nr:cob(I)yrinic acid a,c-diamide adenosyltransferase [Anaerolineae bacterium]
MTYRKGLLQVYTGNGEGMAMAAAGQALRAAGQGFRVRVIEFLQGNSERSALRTALVGQGGITINELGQHTASITEAPELADSGLAQQALDAAEAATASGEYDLVILDQVNLALEWKLIELHDLLSILRHKHEKVEVILTGSCAHPEVIALADLVTEMRQVKGSARTGTVPCWQIGPRN